MIKRLVQLILDAQAAKKLEKDVDRSMKRVARESESTISKAFKRIGAVIVAAFSVRVIANFTREMFKLGSSATETASKFKTVFGPERAAELDDFLSKFSRLAGLTRSEGREMLANFGAVFEGAGLAADASADLSRKMLQLAADLQSFHNVPIEDAFAAIRSGATGEAEPLKRFGIVLRAVDVDARALADTGKKTSAELTEQERVVARLQLIYEKAGVAVGDLERTQGSEANTARRISTAYRQIKEDVATGLLPVFAALLPTFEQLSQKALEFADHTGQAVQALLEMAGLANQTSAIEIAGITRSLTKLDDAQKKAFLASRLQRAAADYDTLLGKIREIESQSRALQLFGDPDKNAGQLEDLKRELEAAGQVMNFLSRQMASMADAADRASQAAAQMPEIPEIPHRKMQVEVQGPEKAVAPFDISSENLALERYKDHLSELNDHTTHVAESMTSAFEDFFAASATGFEGQGGIWQAAAQAARGAGAAIVEGLVAGRAEEQIAAGTAAIASGTWPPNPAAIAAGLKHFAAAALYKAIPGIIRGGGGSGGGGGISGGGGSALPPGAVGSSVPGTAQVPGAELNIFIDPLNPSSPVVQRFVQAATQNARETYGENVQVNVRPRTGAG